MAWLKSFVDRLRGRQPRRRHERYRFETPLKLKGAAWKHIAQAVTSDVSEGGFFVPTTRKAQQGELLAIELEGDEGKTVKLTGKVAYIVTPEKSAQLRKPPGLGIELVALGKEEREWIVGLVEAARCARPPLAGAADSRATPSSTSSPSVKTRKPIVGIDLGTTTVAVGARVGGQIQLLRWEHGDPFLPAVVAIQDRGRVLVGPEARDLLARQPRRTVGSPKRFLGRTSDDREIAPALAQAPYKVETGPDGTVVLRIDQEAYAVTQICSYLLAAARDRAEAALGAKVERCVMTVPVSFDDARLEAYRRAARLAGLDVAAFIDEPSSAALANRYQQSFVGTVGVYDFGGGTFDFSVVDATGGDFAVLGTGGDSWLGGDDFDECISRHLANVFFQQTGLDVTRDAVAWHRLRRAAELAKRTLSTQESSRMRVTEIGSHAGNVLDLDLPLTRSELEQACRNLVERSLRTCTNVLDLVDVAPSDLQSVFLSGGTTRIPQVRRLLGEHLGVPILAGVPPEEAVCLGAAAHAHQIEYDLDPTLDFVAS